jgi:multiple sugar transport system permease protein
MSIQTAIPKRRTASISNMRRQEAIFGYLFIAPALILFLVFIAWPIVESLRLSLYEWNIFQPPKFVGLDNYERILNDSRVKTGFQNTITFAGMVVILDVLVALTLAVMIQHKMPRILRNIYRTAFILPIVTSLAAMSIILRFMLDTHTGVINYYLLQLGFDRVRWLDSTDLALPTLAFVTVWKTFGFDLLLFSAGIQNIPAHLYEAAEIDGGNAWHKLRYITLPQLSPTIFFVVVVGLITHLQMFDQAQIMTSGGPGESTTTTVMLIWDKLGQLQYGYGSTIATVFFGFVLILTVIQFWFSRRWVYYEGARESE